MSHAFASLDGQRRRSATVLLRMRTTFVLHDFRLRAFCFQDYDIFLTNN